MLEQCPGFLSPSPGSASFLALRSRRGDLHGDGASSMTGSARGAQYDRFVSLFARHEQAVRSFVRSLLPSWQDVDDVMQEIVLVCWRKFDAFEVTGSADEFALGLQHRPVRGSQASTRLPTGSARVS